jgi:hypothetical protein
MAVDYILKPYANASAVKGKQLGDDDLMPFGKYKGTPLQDIEARYFHYLWQNGMKKERTPVAEYIRKSIHAFQVENPDLIWS